MRTKLRFENSKKDEFRNVIRTIAFNKCGKVDPHKLTFNLDQFGFTKFINIKGDTLDDVIAYCYKVNSDKNKYELVIIQNSDFISFTRNLKLNKIDGNEVEIIKNKRKVIEQMPAKMELEVGKCYVLGSYFGDHIIKIIGKTSKQYKYVMLYSSFKDNDISSKIRYCINNQLDYNFSVDISEMSFDPDNTYGDVCSLKLSRDGYWIDGRYSINKDNSYNESHYML